MSCTNYDDATVREISIIDIVGGFLCYQLPIHVCLSTRHKIGIDLTFSMGDVLLELAGCVHSVVALYPANLVEQTEKRELISEPAKDMSVYCKLRGFLRVHVRTTNCKHCTCCVCVCATDLLNQYQRYAQHFLSGGYFQSSISFQHTNLPFNCYVSLLALEVVNTDHHRPVWANPCSTIMFCDLHVQSNAHVQKLQYDSCVEYI